MRFKLAAGREIDVLTKEELKEGLTATTASLLQEKARGFSTARYDTTGTPNTGSLTLPAPGSRPIGPESGHAWALQRVTADGLQGSDVLVVYRNSPTPANRLGIVTATSSLSCGSKGFIFRGDERLIAVGTALTATDDVTICGEAIEVAESDLYKIL